MLSQQQIPEILAHQLRGLAALAQSTYPLADGLRRRGLHRSPVGLGSADVRMAVGRGQVHCSAAVQSDSKALNRGTHIRLARLVAPHGLGV
jgi:hypothetical protein